MKLLSQIKAGRLVQKLKSSGSLTPEATTELKNELVAMGPSAIPVVLECLSHGEARTHALEVLSRLLDESTLGEYLEALRSPNPAVVSGVGQVLAKAKGYDASRLIDLLSDSDFSKSALETILWAQVGNLPARRLIDKIPDVGKDARAVIFRLLEKIESPSLVPDLLDLIGHDDWWVRHSVARILGERGDLTAAKGLMRLTKDVHKSVRLEAVTGLHRLREPSAIPPLAARLRDEDLKVQTAAIDALIDLGDASAVPHLLEVLKDESEYARRAAVEVLNAVATPEAVQDLVRALRDEDWWVRVRAADALGTLGGDRVVDGVVSLLAEPDEFIRRYAVEILNAVPSRRAVEPLIKALHDPDWWVRERSIDALAKTGDPRGVEPLEMLLREDVSAAPHCVRALGMLGDPRALPTLARLVDSEEDEIRREAVNAILAFSRGKDLSPEDRALANEALGRAHIEPQKRSGGSRRGLDPLSFPLDGSRRSPSADLSPLGMSGIPVARKADPPTSPPPQEPAESEQRGSPVPGQPDSSEGGLNFLKLPRDATLLGRYRVVRQIGKGGFGAIYLVQDSAIQEEMILKILNPQLSMDETAIRRFVQELKLTRSITHRNVIRLYDFLDLGGARAVSMEYFPSRDLGKIVRAEGAMAPDRAIRILAQVCDGLTAAHDAGVIHRDIKPANVLVGKDDSVKIVDFGLASMETQAGSRLTKSGLLIGTPEYMAPEQISGGEVDHRADLYSLGVLMYEVFSGRKPFSAETPVKVLFLHLEGEAPPLSSLVPDLPAGIEAMVKSTMAKKPADRPQSAQALLALLEEIRDGLERAA